MNNIASRRRVGEPAITENILEKFRAAYESEGEIGIAKAAPTDLIRTLTATGSADQVRSRIRDYRDAGVRLPIVRPANDLQMNAVIEAVST